MQTVNWEELTLICETPLVVTYRNKPYLSFRDSNVFSTDSIPGESFETEIPVEMANRWQKCRRTTFLPTVPLSQLFPSTK